MIFDNVIGLIVYSVAAFGLAYVIGHSQISMPFRVTLAGEGNGLRAWLVDLLECPACLGFHIGWIAGLGAGYGWRCLALAAFTTGSNFILARLTGLVPAPNDLT